MKIPISILKLDLRPQKLFDQGEVEWNWPKAPAVSR